MTSFDYARGVGWFSKKAKAKAETELWRSKLMHLRVAAPLGKGWQRMEGGGGATLAAMKCVRGEPPEALSLEALLLGAEGHDPPTVDELATRDWSAELEAAVDDLQDVRAWRAEHQARPGQAEAAVDVAARGRLREPAMAVRLRERHVPVGDKLLVIKVMGAPALFDEHQSIIDTWIAHAMLPG